MPWDPIHLSDGTSIPSLAYGTGRLKNGDSVIGWVKQAITAGFIHFDVAQIYGNEEETGKAILESGVSRDKLYITTKFSGQDNLTILEAAQASLKKLGVDQVDLYLIHHPRWATPDIPTAWAQMEKLKANGLTKSLGVSNFNVEQLQSVLKVANIKPVANQIEVHPYNLVAQLPVIEYGDKHGILTEGYSPLQSLRNVPGGPVDEPVNDIAARLNVTPEQVLLAWAKSKKIVVITSSRDAERVALFLSAGDIALSMEDIVAIDDAGNKGALWAKACSKAGTVLPWEEGKTYDA